MKVPFIDITRFEDGFLAEWESKVAAMSKAAQFVGGPEVANLEERLARTVGATHAVGCANGTDAIQLALRALDVGPGDTVLVPDATFWATFEAVVNVGATPFTVDISLADGGICADALEDAIRKVRPKAAIVVHLYGWGPTRLADIRALCAQEGVKLIEDGAQCFGALYQDNPVLAGALISTTSFYPAKVLGAAGDGGAVFTDQPELADKVRRLGNHGRTSHYGHGYVGWNSRLDALQAAFLNLALDHLDARVASRRQSADRYRELLPAAGLSPLDVPAGYVENGYCNVCLMADADAKQGLETLLRDRGIGFGNIYPGAMSAQPGAGAYLGGHFGGDGAVRLSRQVLNLPLFPYMTSDEIDYVVQAVFDAGLGR